MTTARCLLQQAIHAKLQISPATETDEAQYVEIQRGAVVYVCFFKDCNKEILKKAVNSLLNVRLSFCEERKKNVSVLELPGDVLIVPQATLGGKMKGKATQYHSNIPREEGLELYEEFVKTAKQLVEETKTDSVEKQRHVKYGTYGNRQVLSLETNGPYSHIFEF